MHQVDPSGMSKTYSNTVVFDRVFPTSTGARFRQPMIPPRIMVLSFPISRLFITFLTVQ